jgi:tetratricopeptide (TPR) repeat protein
MAVDMHRARDLFLHAVGKLPPEQWDAYIARACGPDGQMQRYVAHLLEVHRQAGTFLERPAPGVSVTGPLVAPPRSGAAVMPAEGPGTQIGPYQLLEKVGEGGMGMVFVAQQRQPVRRKVALKVIKPGMDSRAVIARFEAERQALALMDHTHIAKVLDGGTTASGRPYFVMELVEGVPLTDFCDRERLAPRERLGLFGSVCRAVQHAHQKGIIHRDLKPSNVLVARQDGVPVVKVIDFGLAKALEQRLTDKTLVTGLTQVVGTPLYMSPEQAEPGGLDIDTRSDIYSLGVLLYELLTGTTPVEQERLSQASFEELRRIIREEEPPRPSTRISTLGPAAVTLSEQRRTDPKQLGQLLRGELDWVVMKCLEKDRTRRYETADALAKDVERYLADEPVEACPPSATYRLGKFLRKHRRPLLTAAAFLVLLLGAGVLVGWQAVREAEAEQEREVREARGERDRALEQAKRAAAVRDALDRVRALREEARQAHDSSKWARAREQAQRALALVESGPADAALAVQVKQVQDELEEEEKDRRFVADLEAARLAQGETAAGQNRFANERAIPLYRKAFRAYGLPVGEADPAAAAARLRDRPLEVRQAVSAVLDDWLDLAANPALQIREPHRGWLRALAAAELDGGQMRELRAAAREPDPTRRRATLERLARAADLGRWPPVKVQWLARRLEAAQATPSAVLLLRRAWRQYPADFWVNSELGNLLWLGQPPHLEEAVRHLTAAVALRPDSPGAHLNLGGALEAEGQFDEAIACFRRALDMDPAYAMAHHNLAVALKGKGRLEQAIACFRRAIELDPNMALGHYHLGEMLAAKGRRDEAIACYRRAIDLNPKMVEGHVNLGLALYSSGRLDEAIACFRRAIELDPKNADAPINLSGALLGKGRLDEAIAYARRAIKLAPKNVEAHCNLGAALAEKGRLDQAIVCYRRALKLGPNHPETLRNLGMALQQKGRLDDAIACYRRAVERGPKSFVAHYNLGVAFQKMARLDEAITCFRRAVELDPKHAGAHIGLGVALHDKGRLDEAVACFRRALKLDSKSFRAHYNLGVALQDKGRLDEAIACFRRAIEIDPKYASAHDNLGIALDAKGRTDEAIACYRRAIALDPKMPKAHNNLGAALSDKGQLDEAIACYHRAIALDPKYVIAHYHLALTLRKAGRVDEAIACLRRTLKLDPRFGRAHWYLGALLEGKGQADEAIACYRQAIALDPKFPLAHFRLGDTLQNKGLPGEAIACYRRAIALDPQLAEAYCNLGQALSRIGEFRKALAAVRTGHALGSRQKNWPYPSAEWVKKYERHVQLDDLLAAIPKGKARSAGAAECLELADFCRDPKQHHAAAVRFYTEAFTTRPKLAADLKAAYRYHAALSAALAGGGLGRDAADLSAAERARLRGQALQWLRADLDLCTKQVENGSAPARRAARGRMQAWLREPGLVGVRDAAGLASLPAGERRRWQAFWADVAAVRTKVRPEK